MSVQETAKSVTIWWYALQPVAPGKGDRAALARLRRASTVLDAAQEEATVRLARQLGGLPALEQAALCAAVLASVRKDEKQQRHVARQIGARNGQAPLMSPLRFRRLVQAESIDERLIQFRRLVALARNELNVIDLAAALLDWSEWRKRAWIFWYYDADPPQSNETSQPTPEGAVP